MNKQQVNPQSQIITEIVEQTFTEAFQSVAAVFIQNVKTLKTSVVTVEKAKEEAKVAQDNFANAQKVVTDLVVLMEGFKTSAKSSRDDLVVVLQSWTPD